MDEHSSQAGVVTRIEAFLDGCAPFPALYKRRELAIGEGLKPRSARATRQARTADVVYIPNMCEHSYGFAAAARSVGIEAEVLPPPDLESERLGRPHMIGGECHPYVLVLGII